MIDASSVGRFFESRQSRGAKRSLDAAAVKGEDSIMAHFFVSLGRD
jgi:hypothetical protein